MVRLADVGMGLQIAGALSKRHTVGTLWLGWNVDRDYAPCPPEHYRLNFGEILLYGSTPQLHAQTIFEVDQSEMSTVREMFELVERLRPTLLDAHLVSYAALVIDWDRFSPSEHFKGLYRALIENHVPFQVIPKSDLRSESLSRFKSLILPNVTRLSDEEVTAIRDFHEAGGGVVCTYRTGWLEPDGTLRPSMPLAEMAGVRGPFGIVTNPAGHDYQLLPSTYYRIVADHPIGAGTEGRLQSFRGSYVELETFGGTVIAQALDYDYSRMHQHHPVIGWYPGHAIAPLIVVNDPPGRGRAVYFAGEFDRATHNDALPGTLNSLAQATVWAAGVSPPVEVECAPTVEMATHFSESQQAFTVLMVNQTTNDLQPAMVVRYVETLRDVRIRLRGIGRVKEVRSLTGADPEWAQEESECEITLSRLREYEALVVQI